MSIEAFGWAWSLDLPCKQKMVLLALADVYPPERAAIVWPRRLAEVSGLSMGEVEEAKSALRERGLVLSEGAYYSLSLPVRAPAPERPEPVSFLYVMRSSGATKVGISFDPLKRLSSLRGSTPSPVTLVHTFSGPVSSVRQWERSFHGEHEACRVPGEWFACSADAAVQALRALTGQEGVAA